jgi:hypothetical protein
MIMRVCDGLKLDPDVRIDCYADIRRLFEEDPNFPPVMLALLEWLWNELSGHYRQD